jgi:hypothetical protein
MMKVYGGHNMVRGHGQVRCIVAANNQKEAAAIVGLSLYYMRMYWSETGNKEEVAAALARPRTLLFSKKDYGPGRLFEEVPSVNGDSQV